MSTATANVAADGPAPYPGQPAEIIKLVAAITETFTGIQLTGPACSAAGVRHALAKVPLPLVVTALEGKFTERNGIRTRLSFSELTFLAEFILNNLQQLARLDHLSADQILLLQEGAWNVARRDLNWRRNLHLELTLAKATLPFLDAAALIELLYPQDAPNGFIRHIYAQAIQEADPELRLRIMIDPNVADLVRLLKPGL